MLFVPLRLIVRLVAVFVMPPVPRFRSLVPPKMKLAPMVMGLLFIRVIAPAVVLLIVPALIVNVPVPSAVVLSMFNVPALSVVPPL